MKAKMRLTMIVTAAVVVSVVIILGAMILYHNKGPAAASSQQTQHIVYHCPMHPNYLSDKPGNCPICGMKLVPVSQLEHQSEANKNGQRKILYYRDAMNPSYTSPNPGKAPDGMDLVPVYEDGASGEKGAVKIDPVTVQNIGVTTETAARRTLTKEIQVSANLEVNETSIGIVNTKVMGWVEKLYIDFTGQPIKKGQPLLTIYSPDLVSAQTEYLQAIRYVKGLPPGASEEAKHGAEELVESSKRRLLNWDIPDKEIKALEDRGAPEKTMTIYSPIDGVVLEKMVAAGQNVMPGTTLYKVADLSTLWAIANVFQQDLPLIKIGMEASIEVSSLPGRTFTGRVQFVSPVLDLDTKTAAVRISIRNSADRALKPQMFADIKISSPMAVNGLSVSEQAVIHSGKRDLVIVALGNGYFRPQDVKVGANAGGFVQILSGIAEGQTIVTSSQFLIDAESNLKEAVGAMSPPESARAQSAASVPEKPAALRGGRSNMQGMNMPGTN
ncbi:MAG TPA: efflux RND transporter periplasmic adaptor subunit [Chitinivibrionales bacterium]|nr:efflux RND transporter periplasmic adaptor subunit [Chitinivibrionales bacterium]